MAIFFRIDTSQFFASRTLIYVSEFMQPIECISFLEAWIFASSRNVGMVEYWNVEAPVFSEIDFERKLLLS